MNAFTDAMDALFADPNLATTGAYTPFGGSPVTVKVLRGGPRINSLSLGQGESGGELTAPYSLLTSEVALRPARDGTLVVDGVTYIIESAEAGARGAIWRLDLRPAE